MMTVFVLLVIFLVGSVHADANERKEVLILPTGDLSSDAKLGNTFDLVNLYYKIQIMKNPQDNMEVKQLNMYKESVTVVEKSTDFISDVLSQPVILLLLTSERNQGIGGPVQEFLQRKVNRKKFVEVILYAQKIEKIERMSDDAQPKDDWENMHRVKGAKHYVKEIVYGSLFLASFTFEPTEGNKLEDVKQQIKDIVNKPSDRVSAEIIREIMKSKKISKGPMTLFSKGGPNSGLIGNVDQLKAYLEKFRVAESSSRLTVGLRPLMDFNPKSQHFSMKYEPKSFSAFMDKMLLMYEDVSRTEDEISEFSREEKFIHRMKILRNDARRVRLAILSVMDNLDFNKGSEQFIPAFTSYKYHIGYYQERLEEFYDEWDNSDQDGKGGENQEDKLESNEEVLKKLEELQVKVNNILPRGYFTVKLNKKATGAKRVVFKRFLSSGENAIYSTRSGFVTARDNGLYHFSYSLQKESIKKTTIRIMKGNTVLAEGTSDDGKSCANNDCSQVISGSFTMKLNKGDKLQVMLVEGNLGSESLFSGVMLQKFE